ncbi:hypothetical protein ACOMHN_026517 [Nucella lapillus]
MSDEDREIDIESDEEEDQDQDDQDGSSNPNAPVDKRAHHNALERKRRDHIKDSFHNLRDCVPTVHGEKLQASKQVSRAQILKKAADYIQDLRSKTSSNHLDIENLKKANHVIQSQIKMLEKYADTSQFAARTRQQANRTTEGGVESERSEDDPVSGQPSRKKIKTVSDS